ncbi:hypothetical protein ASG31_16210 [Chryseobacterium sp. Leaf404]|uniref:hypothetical protein n=1 Tax=unclassified Chryseobacterium TaxID=2593645 RepID=UPI0006FF5BD3|nr:MULTISPECIES: hypothetical protein [unclassified Chryseobacterium]KQT21418.1 hypothetical protein ASG31_16210 [Chryseobacterium sp. Leaf404]
MITGKLFSDKVYISNILRNMLASGIGFLTVWILYMFSEDYFTEENIIISGFLIFMIFAGLFFYSSTVENVLYILLKKKRIVPFVVTHFSLIAIVLFAQIYFGAGGL